MSSNEGKCLIMIILTPKTIDFKRAGINMLHIKHVQVIEFCIPRIFMIIDNRMAT